MPICTSNAKKGARSLRKGRVSIPGQVYHIITVTRHKEPLFLDLYAGRAVVNSLRHEQLRGRARTLTFVVMPDHLHWLLQLMDACPLSRVVQNVKANSARSINRLLRRRSPVWQTAFYDRAIRRDEDLISVSRYIVGNPLRAEIVTSLDDYPLWDSVWL